VVRCDDCDVFLCRGTNQKRPVLYCPSMSPNDEQVAFDPYLVDRLLAERGTVPLGGSTVEAHWAAAGKSDEARREILLTQVDSLRLRRGVVGRYFDEDRVLLRGGGPRPQPSSRTRKTCRMRKADLRSMTEVSQRGAWAAGVVRAEPRVGRLVVRSAREPRRHPPA
jgi:hypothetical protein